jgi:hypothetical protein
MMCQVIVRFYNSVRRRSRMRKAMVLTILIITCVGAAGIVSRAGQDDGFSKFYADFQAAVKAGDKEKVASMINFDDFFWEATDALREVKTRNAFLKNYDKMFTLAIKNKIATSKPKKDPKGYYHLIWHTTNFEYGLEFSLLEDGSYRFEGYTVGPY